MSSPAGPSSSSIAAQASHLRTEWAQAKDRRGAHHQDDDNEDASDTASDTSSGSSRSLFSGSSWDSDAEDAMVQEEWDESVRQMQMLVSIVLLPFLGKWMGRRWSYWAYDRYKHVGLGAQFFGLQGK